MYFVNPLALIILTKNVIYSIHNAYNFNLTEPNDSGYTINSITGYIHICSDMYIILILYYCLYIHITNIITCFVMDIEQLIYSCVGIGNIQQGLFALQLDCSNLLMNEWMNESLKLIKIIITKMIIGNCCSQNTVNNYPTNYVIYV